MLWMSPQTLLFQITELPKQFDLPCSQTTAFSGVISEYQLYNSGHTSLACHHIPTKGPPIHVPSRRVLAHYRNEVKRQYNKYLNRESSPRAAAPLLFLKGLVNYIDYRQLNKQTVKKCVSLTLPTE